MATLTASTPFRMDLANPIWDAWNAYGSNTSNLQWTSGAQNGPSGTYYNTALEFWWHDHSRVLHFAGDFLNLPYPYPDGFWGGTIQAIFEPTPADYFGTAKWSLEGISLPANTFATIGRTSSLDDDRRLFLSFFDRADTFHLSNAADVAMGLGGNDTMYGNGGADLLYGGVGSDTLYGESGNDSLHGEAGNDWLDGGLGADRLEGGVGNDIYIVANADDIIVERANAGNDEVRAGFSYALGANVENLLLIGAENINGTGNALANRLTGSAGRNVLNGGLGEDSLYGGAGNDTLQGGSGSDRLEGGSGDDVYVLADAGDIVVESANAGTDQVRVGYSYTLGANVENLLLTGSGHLKGTGNGLGNQLIGNAGQNVLSGHAGNDTLQGGGGNDALYGGNGNDRLTGGTGNDTLLGERDNDLLDGGEGNNNLNAGLGDDTLLSGAGSDTINAGAGNDRVTAGTGGDRVFGLDGNDIIDSGAGHDIVIGGAGNDLMRGGDGNDDLAAEGGSDTLDGGAGNDMLRGSQGVDLFIFNDGLDTIRNFDRAEDRIDLRSFSGLHTWADVQNHLQQEGGHVTFRHGDDVLKIEWTQSTVLGSDDFIW